MKPTQEQVIAWARDSGMELYGLAKDRAKFVYYLEAFAALAYEAGRKDENEACAQVCDEEAEDNGNSEEWVYHTATGLAASIRARREQ